MSNERAVDDYQYSYYNQGKKHKVLNTHIYSLIRAAIGLNTL